MNEDIEGAILLKSVVRKLINDETVVLNDDGYIVVDDASNEEFGSRCIELTPDEFAVVKSVLAGKDGS